MGAVTSITTATRRPRREDSTETRIEKLLAEARLKLIETGTRNRLIHTPRGLKRTRSLPIIGARSDAIFAGLVREGRALHLLAADHARDDEPADPATQNIARLVTNKPGHANRNGLQTALSPEHLHKRLHMIYRDAKTAEEERGVNILFLALGFLRWYEDEKSDVQRQAPLVLLPLNLVRDVKRSTFDVTFRDDDIGANQALQERLRSDFGIAFPDVPETENWLPSAYFATIANAIATKRRWSIDADGVELGFYSSSKLMMIRDLEPANWPDNALLEHPLLRGLLHDGFASEAPILPESANLDAILHPVDLIHVVDADASQTRVIESVRAGRNLIVQGPPGTGKSQTITNIIATAAHDGKSVLFVAEKMAALNVVHDRLRQAGLEDICLELHSHTANKRLVADRLDRTLQSPVDCDLDDEDAAARLTAVRDVLNHVAKRMHAPIGQTAMTPYQALSIQIAAAVRHVTPDFHLVDAAARWTRREFDEKQRRAEQLANLTASAGPLQRHVYFGVGQTALQPTDFQRLAPQLQQLADDAAALAANAFEVAHYLDLGLQKSPTLAGIKTLIALFRIIASLPRGAEPTASAIAAAPSLPRVTAAAALGAKWRQHQARHYGAFHPAAWTAPLEQIRAPLARGATFWPARFGRAYRVAGRSLASLSLAPLPSRLADRLAVLDILLIGQTLSGELAAEATFLATLLGEAWRGRMTDFALIHRVARILEKLTGFDAQLNVDRALEVARDGVGAAFADDFEKGLNALSLSLGGAIQSLDLDIAAIFEAKSVDAINLEALAERAAQWASNHGRFEEWTRLAKADRQLRAIGPASIADALACGRLQPGRASIEIEAAFAEACWKKAIAVDADLASFDGKHQDSLIALFKALEVRRRRAAALSVRARHQAELPRGALGAMGVIRGEIGRKRNHMPLRKLMKAAGDTIQKIKPVFLMSPLSVAHYLPPGAVNFDLLVIDEASQVRPGDALGLIARCRQIVVVGDKKQLPPTQFFDRMIADDVGHSDDEDLRTHGAPMSDLESILSLCEARGLESQMLRWHYRSRHPSLIEVSNAEFYKHLVMPPAPTTERKDKGLVLRRVPGAYDRGGLRTNLVEAESIARAVAEHARAAPALSLGIITFSTAQRDLISDCLETSRRSDPVLDAYLRDGGREDVFVKNLENVQGDERDVILISIGYGPRQAGKPLDSMVFGPVSAEGGERRLNVLFTRARTRCEVFVSFGSSDINLERATGAGPRVLRRFLQFAETGILEESKSTGGGFDSPFEANVAAAIESFGYKVEAQVGSAGFRIDLAARDPANPSRFILAIECDGATYHSALWARERDRLRQEVLEGLGWRIHRIWSTDWFYRRGEQMRNLKAALDAARNEAAEASPSAAPAADNRDDEPLPDIETSGQSPARYEFRKAKKIAKTTRRDSPAPPDW